MELIRSLRSLRPSHHGCVATIGTFDGVHLGHQSVLKQVRAKADELSLPSVVVVFEPLPGEYLSPQKAPARLMRFREKFVALRSQGLDLQPTNRWISYGSSFKWKLIKRNNDMCKYFKK